MLLAGLACLGLMASTGCQKHTPAAPVQATNNYSYDRNDLNSILEKVDEKYGTAYSASAASTTKPIVKIIPGIPDRWNYMICYDYFTGICEVIVIDSPNGKVSDELRGQKADIISCTSPSPVLNKGVTIADVIETDNSTQIVLE